MYNGYLSLVIIAILLSVIICAFPSDFLSDSTTIYWFFNVMGCLGCFADGIFLLYLSVVEEQREEQKEKAKQEKEGMNFEV